MALRYTTYLPLLPRHSSQAFCSKVFWCRSSMLIMMGRTTCLMSLTSRKLSQTCCSLTPLGAKWTPSAGGSCRSADMLFKHAHHVCNPSSTFCQLHNIVTLMKIFRAQLLSVYECLKRDVWILSSLVAVLVYKRNGCTRQDCILCSWVCSYKQCLGTDRASALHRTMHRVHQTAGCWKTTCWQLAYP